MPVYVPEKRRVSIHFVADEDFLKALDDARALMRHKYPAGRLEDVFGEALRIYLERKNPQRSLPSRQLAPPNASRNIPAYVKALVWKRDQGRCTFVSPEKKRCDAREGLEFDHKIPWSMGGRSTERNLRLLCRAHNQHAARMAFGEKWIEKKIEETKSRR